MAFTYDKFNDVENIVKATGLSEDELASLIINKENEGFTNDEIVDLLVSNFDNKEYASKAQDELDALYSLGFNPPKDYNPTGGKRYQQWQEAKEDPSLLDRFTSWYAANKDADEQRKAAERAAIANSVTDWRDSHPEQWRVGMVNSIFGDNNMLSQYYAAKQAAEEGEKNRESQREYNEYLKEYDRAQLEEEKAKRESIAKATAEAQITELLDGYGYKTPQQRELIDRQINVAVADGGLNLEAVNALKDLAVKNAEDEMLERSAKNAVLDPIKSKIRLHGAYSAEPNWKNQSSDYIKAIQRTVGIKADGVYGKKTAAAIEAWNAKHPEEKIVAPNDLENILDEIDQLKYVHNGAEKQFNPAELDELRKMVYGGEDPTTKRREDWDEWQHQRNKDAATKAANAAELTKQAWAAIKNNTNPSELSDEVKTKIRELRYTWKNNKWRERKDNE